MVGGGGVRLAAESAVQQAEFFLALDARQDEPPNQPRSARPRRQRDRSANGWKNSSPTRSARERGVMFDEQRQRVVGFTATYYRDLLLREDRNAAVDPGQAAVVLAEALRPAGREIFRRRRIGDDLARLGWICCGKRMPEHPWPAFDAEQLASFWPRPSWRAARSLEDLRKVSLVPLLQSMLVYPLDRLFEQHAPQTIEVPSGSQIRIDYSSGRSRCWPCGCRSCSAGPTRRASPAGAWRCVLHLLGPNYRPVQITEDLRSFWTTTYFQVRKDLRTRYPKHSWPEDPLTATPERGVDGDDQR